MGFRAVVAMDGGLVQGRTSARKPISQADPSTPISLARDGYFQLPCAPFSKATTHVQSLPSHRQETESRQYRLARQQSQAPAFLAESAYPTLLGGVRGPFCHLESIDPRPSYDREARRGCGSK